MKITKIDNGYTVEYAEENKTDKSSCSWDGDSAYTYHTYAFKDWSDLIDWIKDMEEFV